VKAREMGNVRTYAKLTCGEAEYGDPWWQGSGIVELPVGVSTEDHHAKQYDVEGESLQIR
jgi:hypothetical protein